MALESKQLKVSLLVVLMAWVFARSVFAAEAMPEPAQGADARVVQVAR